MAAFKGPIEIIFITVPYAVHGGVAHSSTKHLRLWFRLLRLIRQVAALLTFVSALHALVNVSTSAGTHSNTAR